MINIVDKNAFYLRITGKTRIGEYETTLDMNVIDSLIVNFVRRGRVPQTYTIDANNRVLVYNSGILAKGVYGVELVGYYNGQPWRHFASDVFAIVDSGGTTPDSAISNIDVFDVTIYMKLSGDGVTAEFVQAMMEEHNADAAAHSEIRDEIPAKVSDLSNDSGFQTAQQVSNTVQTAILGSMINDAEASLVENGGEPDLVAGISGQKLILVGKNLKGEKGDDGAQGETGAQGPQGIPGVGAIWNGNEEVLTELEQGQGDAINRTMSQLAITEVTSAKNGVAYPVVRTNCPNDNGVWQINSSYYHYQMKVEPGQVYKIKAKATSFTRVWWCTAVTTSPTASTTVPFVNGVTSSTRVEQGETAFLTVPAGCQYMYIQGGDTASPDGLWLVENIQDVSSKQGAPRDNEFDWEDVTLDVGASGQYAFYTNDRPWGVTVRSTAKLTAKRWAKIKGIDLVPGKTYILEFDYASDFASDIVLMNASEMSIARFYDQSDNIISIAASSSGHFSNQFKAPSDCTTLAFSIPNNTAKNKNLWIENVVLKKVDADIDESYAAFKTKTDTDIATINQEVFGLKNVLSEAFKAIEDMAEYAVSISDGNRTSSAGNSTTTYIPTLGAKKIYVQLPTNASQTYGLAFYARQSYTSFIQGHALGKASQAFASVWVMYDVPEGANFFRYTVVTGQDSYYKYVLTNDYLAQIYKDAAAGMVATQIMRSATPVSPKTSIYAFALQQLNIINNKAYCYFYENENDNDCDNHNQNRIINPPSDASKWCRAEIDLFDNSVSRIYPTIGATIKPDGTVLSPYNIGFITHTETPDGQIGYFAEMRFNDSAKNPYFCYAFADVDDSTYDFTTCKLSYEAGGQEYLVDFRIETYRQMLVDMGYASQVTASNSDVYNNVNLHYNKDEEKYYAVLCTARSEYDLPVVLMESEDLETWTPKACIETTSGGEIGAIYKDGIVYVCNRTFNDGMRWDVYDVENQEMIGSGTFPVSPEMLSKPDVFTYAGDVYMAINVDPTIFGQLRGASNYGQDARQEIAIYKMVDGAPKFFRRVNNPTGINYFAFQETPPMYAANDSTEPMLAQGEIYIVFSEDRRHLFRRQFGQVSFADVTALFANKDRIL